MWIILILRRLRLPVGTEYYIKAEKEGYGKYQKIREIGLVCFAMWELVSERCEL